MFRSIFNPLVWHTHWKNHSREIAVVHPMEERYVVASAIQDAIGILDRALNSGREGHPMFGEVTKNQHLIDAYWVLQEARDLERQIIEYERDPQGYEEEYDGCVPFPLHPNYVAPDYCRQDSGRYDLPQGGSLVGAGWEH